VELDAQVWDDESRANASRTIIEMLEEETRQSDFAVVLLSKDDVMLAGAAGDLQQVEKRKARDNCIFEAGMFIAALGRERCFLVSSVEPADLPTDLAGVIVLRFRDTADYAAADPAEAERQASEAMADIGLDIAQRVEEKKSIKPQRISRRMLLDRQKKITEGGELYEGQLVAAILQPLDLTADTVGQIYKNITDGIEYFLFMPQKADAGRKACQLLQMLLLSGLFRRPEDADDFRRRQELVRANKDEVIDKLKAICSSGGLKVFFSEEFHELEFCIHNADDELYAVQYVKHGEDYLEWATGTEARRFWNEVKKRRPMVVRPCPETALLYPEVAPAAEAVWPSGDFEGDLRGHLRRYFPSLEDRVFGLCIRGLVSEDERGS
jgi:hypothetical protein